MEKHQHICRRPALHILMQQRTQHKKRHEFSWLLITAGGRNKDKAPIYDFNNCVTWNALCWFFIWSLFSKSAEELNKWLLSPNIPFRTSKSLCMVWLPVTSNHSHKSDVTVWKWVAKEPKAKLLKATVALNGRVAVADRTVKSNNVYFLLRGTWWGKKKKLTRQWLQHTDCVSHKDPQRRTCIISTSVKKPTQNVLFTRQKVIQGCRMETTWGAESKSTYGCHQSGWWWCPGRCSVERGAPSSPASRPAGEKRRRLSGGSGGFHQLRRSRSSSTVSHNFSWGKSHPLIQTAGGGEAKRWKKKKKKSLEVRFKLCPEELLSGSRPSVSSGITASVSPRSAWLLSHHAACRLPLSLPLHPPPLVPPSHRSPNYPPPPPPPILHAGCLLLFSLISFQTQNCSSFLLAVSTCSWRPTHLIRACVLSLPYIHASGCWWLINSKPLKIKSARLNMG